ncbi:glycosyltransferase, partial [Enterococcus faecium]|nr:glycosyltransferase [Enterococcus faecium]
MINKICFIAINFNNAQLTLNFVKNLNGLTKSNPQEILDIIIIDNGSNQEDTCILDKETQSISNVTLIKSSINHGYFGGLNLGLKYIENSS